MERVDRSGSLHLQGGSQRGMGVTGGSVYSQVDNWQMRPQQSQPMTTTGYGYSHDAGAPQYQQEQQEPAAVSSQNERKDVTGGGKSPMALLNEICARSKVRPIITVNACPNNPGSSPIFECHITAGSADREAYGRGRNKKEAQHEAARALLLKIDPRVEHFFAQFSQPQKAAAPAQVKPEINQDASRNPVGDITEFCSKTGLRPPVFEEIFEESIKQGEANFKCKCRISELAFGYGQGTNKKMAKKAAAENLLEQIKELRADPATVASKMFPESEIEEVVGKLNALSVKEVIQTQLRLSRAEPPKLTPPKKLVDVLSDMKKLSGPKLESLVQLKSVDFQKADRDHFLLLEEVGQEQKFEVEFLDFRPLPDEPMSKALLSFVIGESRVVFIGKGQSTSLARNSATFSALEYLRLVCGSN